MYYDYYSSWITDWISHIAWAPLCWKVTVVLSWLPTFKLDPFIDTRLPPAIGPKLGEMLVTVTTCVRDKWNGNYTVDHYTYCHASLFPRLSLFLFSHSKVNTILAHTTLVASVYSLSVTIIRKLWAWGWDYYMHAPCKRIAHLRSLFSADHWCLSECWSDQRRWS